VKRIGPIIDERRAVQFQQLRSLDLMNRLTGAGMPFDWTVNPYRGCEVGCTYCYARPTHEYLGHVDPVEFEERIYVKQADTGRLVGALRRARASGQQVAIGTATDPYQPAEGRFEVTRTVLRTLVAVPGVSVGITTKCAAITRDLDLLAELARTCRLTVNMSLISMDRDLLRLIEPRAPRPDLRLAAVEALARRGVPARLFVMPVLPGLTDGEEPTRELLGAAARAGASQAIWNVLFLRGSTRGFFLAFLGREFPWLVPRYRELYGSGAWVAPSYRAEVDRMMERLAAAVGLSAIDRDERVKREGPAAPRQLTLSW
jgi:DNA repair photolyase